MSTTMIELLKKEVSEEYLDYLNEIKLDEELIHDYCPENFGLEDYGDCERPCSECWDETINKSLNKECLLTKEILQYMMGYIFGYLHDKEGMDKEVHNALRHEILDAYGIDIKDEFLL